MHDLEGGGRRFPLTGYRGPADGTIDHRISLQSRSDRTNFSA
jgi:hypothetical protein